MSSKGTINNVHQIIGKVVSEFIKPGFICIDGTIGNGNDSLRLLELLKGEGYLYGFDIQKVAIDNTLKLIKENLTVDNYDLILDSHSNLDKYIDTEIDFYIMNLGYLPGGNKSLTTKSKTTISFLDKANSILKSSGLGIIVFYVGHEAGLIEAREVYKHLKNYNQKDFNILHLDFMNQRNNPPEIVIIERI